MPEFQEFPKLKVPLSPLLGPRAMLALNRTEGFLPQDVPKSRWDVNTGYLVCAVYPTIGPGFDTSQVVQDSATSHK